VAARKLRADLVHHRGLVQRPADEKHSARGISPTPRVSGVDRGAG
jgi:hypothetical protein